MTGRRAHSACLMRWSEDSARSVPASVVTLGNFDGVHLAHQSMLERVVTEAQERDVAACAVTFEPTPREFFSGEAAPARLMTLTEKHAALSALGVSHHVSVRFDARTAGMSPDAFAKRLLRDALGAQHIITGHDFRFGRDRAGDVAWLRDFGIQAGFGVEQIDAFYLNGTLVSSTAIRDALADGNFAAAADLLGRPYTMSGRVVRGQQLGRTLGFATANLRPRRRVLPFEGVLAVRVSDQHGLHEHPGVASLGTRPTVNGRGHLLEVHLFDFQGNLYGRRLHVRFVKKLRDEARFDSLDAMTVQMHRDAEQARAALALEPPITQDGSGFIAPGYDRAAGPN